MRVLTGRLAGKAILHRISHPKQTSSDLDQVVSIGHHGRVVHGSREQLD